MKRSTKVLLGVGGLLLLLVVAIAIAGFIVVRRPLPKTDGTIELPGLQAPVEVLRDEFGIPHIYAENEYDLFFAQGYVHAQDRFWQMEFWRHVSAGRISEIAGEATLESDKFIRTMGWNRIAQETLALYEQDEETMAILNAYSDGVNAYIAAHDGNISMNYTVLGLVNDQWEIEPWTPLDTIGWSVVMADDLSGNWSGELRRARLIDELGAATVANLEPTYPYGRRPVIAPTSELINPPGEAESGLWQRRGGMDTAVDWHLMNERLIGHKPDLGFLGLDEFAGSNNWVISGEHTKSGLPILANDPHLGIQMPSIWYEVGLHAPNWDVVGFSFAGVPGIIIGHNANIAWGVTNVSPDVQDVYIEKVNPNNPDQYEFEGEWLDMEIIEEVIQVNGGEDVVLQVRTTHHGPVITEIVDDANDVLTMRWTAQEPSRLLFSVLALNQAEDFEAFREALRFWDVPSQNIVYADVDGNIGYQMPGLIPIRRNGDGLVPVPGWTGEYEWEGWVPFEELPALYNPENGYIVTANNAVVDDAYPHFIEIYWADGDRAQRIVDMIESQLEGDGEVSIDDVGAMQFDSYSLMAASYVPLLDGLSSDDGDVQAAIERLRGWNYELRRDSVPAALFEIFRRELAYAVLADEVGEDHVSRFGGGVLFHQLAQNPEAIWWDDQRTTKVESQSDILLTAVEETVEWFKENHGDNMNDWTWGSLHTATFISNPLGLSGIGPLENTVNLGPFPVDGGIGTVNANGWSWGNPAGVTGHVSMRMIVDMANFDDSLAVLPTGQSGHPTSPHYDDMFVLWQTGRYHPLWWSREAVETAVVNQLTLLPKEN